MAKVESHYRQENGYYLVEIKLREVRQLFNTLDPAPFRDKDLDSDSETYIYDLVADLPVKAKVRLVLYLPEQACSAQVQDDVSRAIQSYFNYRSDITLKELRAVLKEGHTAMLIGMAFLFACIAAHQALTAMNRPGLLWSILEEGFLISGWVAMWRPIDVFLYEWWPIRRRRRIERKIARMPIDVRPIETSVHATLPSQSGE